MVDKVVEKPRVVENIVEVPYERVVERKVEIEVEKYVEVPVERYVEPMTPFDQKISAKEVSKALASMTNGRAAYDEVSAELLKYTPDIIHKEIQM